MRLVGVQFDPAAVPWAYVSFTECCASMYAERSLRPKWMFLMSQCCRRIRGPMLPIFRP